MIDLGKARSHVAFTEARAAAWIVSEPCPRACVRAIRGSMNRHLLTSTFRRSKAIRIAEVFCPAPLLTLIVGPSEESRAAVKRRGSAPSAPDLQTLLDGSSSDQASERIPAPTLSVSCKQRLPLDGHQCRKTWARKVSTCRSRRHCRRLPSSTSIGGRHGDEGEHDDLQHVACVGKDADRRGIWWPSNWLPL